MAESGVSGNGVYDCVESFDVEAGVGGGLTDSLFCLSGSSWQRILWILIWSLVVISAMISLVTLSRRVWFGVAGVRGNSCVVGIEGIPQS